MLKPIQEVNAYRAIGFRAGHSLSLKIEMASSMRFLLRKLRTQDGIEWQVWCTAGLGTDAFSLYR